MTLLPDQTDILIVGAGPTGLALATALQGQKFSVLQIDRQAAGANTSRAAVVHARTLEVMEPLGVVPRMLETGLPIAISRVRERDKILLEVDFSLLPTAYPFTLMCPQNETEAILLERLQALGGSVVRNTDLLSVRFGAEGAEAQVMCDGQTHTVKARWIVGCDGAHSVVRQQAGIGFEGGAYDEHFVLADVRMTWPFGQTEASLFFSPDGLAVVVPLPGDRFRIVATVPDAPKEPTIDFMQAIMDARGPTGGRNRIGEILWGSRFHVQHRVASTTFTGRMLLCGDAAHVHSPAGGQGMNTGIQDAVALAAPLAKAVTTGATADLAVWAKKRRDIAQGVVGMTDRMTRVGTLNNPAARFARNTALQVAGRLPGVTKRLARKLAELDNR